MFCFYFVNDRYQRLRIWQIRQGKIVTGTSLAEISIVFLGPELKIFVVHQTQIKKLQNYIIIYTGD